MASKPPRVAAIQLPFEYYATPSEFADRVRPPVDQAAREGARLIVLPHRLTLGLLGMFIGDASESPKLEGMALTQGFDSARSLLVARAPVLIDFYVHVFQSLAARAGCWLAPGTTPEWDGTELYWTALLFAPDGEIAGRQRQTHRSESDRAYGFARGAKVHVFETEVGRLGLVLGEDVRYPEVARILALQGANALIHPAAMETASDEQVLADLWRDVQSNQVFGVQANLAGEGWQGRSAVYAPVEMTTDGRGILAQAAPGAGAEIIAADLDFQALQRVIDAYPIFDGFNVELDRDE